MDEYVHLDAEEMRRASNKLGVFLDRAALNARWSLSLSLFCVRCCSLSIITG